MTRHSICLFASLGLLAGPASARPPHPTASAALFDARGHKMGRASIEEYGGQLHLVMHVLKQVPGDHGFHVHTTGMCTPPDFANAGGHWNPDRKQHGLENPMGHHAGDAPNVRVGTNGVARVHLTLGSGSLVTGKAPLLDADGAAIVLHEAADDMKSDPSGNSGKRILCGVLKLDKPAR